VLSFELKGVSSLFDVLLELVLHNFGVLVEVVPGDPSEHEEVKTNHQADVGEPRLVTLLGRVD
jgi:hypothetical protein